MNEKLERCPCCGGESKVKTGSPFLWEHFVVCTNCGISTQKMTGVSPSQARNKAIAAWNQRKPMDDIVERLEAEIEMSRKEGYVEMEYRAGLYDAIAIVKGEV